MRNILFFCVILVLSSILCPVVGIAYEKEIKTVTGKVCEAITDSNKKTVASVDFTDLQGNVTELGRFLAEEFSVAMASSGKGFEVIDRTHLRSILKEHELSFSGMIDPATARKLGKIAGVELLVAGTLTPFGDNIRLSIKLLDTETAKIIDGESMNIPKTSALAELISHSVNGDHNESIRQDGNTPEQRPQTKENKTLKLENTVEENGLVFSNAVCKATDKETICSVIITSKEENKKIYMTTQSRIIDNLGNQYISDEIKIGEQSNSRGISTDFIIGIPSKINLVFNKLSKDATSVTLLEAHCEKFSGYVKNVKLIR